MKITLGPIPYLWGKDQLISFYKEIADTPVSTVYIGDVVCNKRTPIGVDTLAMIGRMLQDAGKEVVISTLGLITNREELEFAESLCKLPFAIEVNNIGILNIRDRGDLIAGPHLAIYNAPSARILAGSGVKRIVFMPELHKGAVESISLGVPSVEKEIIGFGNLPLAFSWRCYTARALGLSKANCAIACTKYPDGMPLETMDGMPIFTINGTQIVSAKKGCMIEQLDILEEMGIDFIRIIPQSRNTPDIIEIFSQVMKGVLSCSGALEALRKCAPEGISNGWFYGQPGWQYVDKKNAEVSAGQAPQHCLQDNT